jgi:ATP-dependent 26S proteasome regulatory subunit
VSEVPPAAAEALRAVVADASEPGGVIALIHGTEKERSLAAEMVAGALQKDLFRVDLSAPESKYIGETEKNLEEVLARAEELGAVLFLDEGDALLGERTDVADASERYANVEVDYLLTVVRARGGVLILGAGGDRLGRALPDIRHRVVFEPADGDDDPPDPE